MYNLIFWIVIFIASLAVLVKSSDYFSDAAERIGIFFGFSPLIVGIVILALGTSLPEIASSLFAVLSNSSEIVAGNVVGSNVTNILLVIGITALIVKNNRRVNYSSLRTDLVLLAASSLLLAGTFVDGVFNFYEGVMFLIFFALIIYYFIKIRKEKVKPDNKIKKRKKTPIKSIFIIFLSIFFIYFGAEYVIKSITELSFMLGIGKDIIAASVVALGTSLPELAVSLSALKRNKFDMAIGNIIGSNIFNTLAVMAVPALFVPLTVSSQIIEFALPMMLIATLIFFFIAWNRKIKKYEGIILVLLYIFFILKLFNVV
jgi:cation:H+ antiporter